MLQMHQNLQYFRVRSRLQFNDYFNENIIIKYFKDPLKTFLKLFK